jgi:signal transduction histidine kinase
MASASVEPMDLRLDERARVRLILILAGTMIVAGWTTLLLGKFDSGVRLATNADHVVVEAVVPGSIAAQYAVEPGMVVTQLDGVMLIEMPHYIDPDPAMPTPDPMTGEEPPYAPTIEPSVPRMVELDPDLLSSLLSQPPTQLNAVQPWDLDLKFYESPVYEVALYENGLDGIRQSLPAFAIGVILLVVVGWWLASGRAGESVRGLAAPLALATAAPFLVQPLIASYALPLVMLSGILVPVAMVPLAWALLERIPNPADRRLVGYGTLGCIVAAVALAVVAAWNGPWFEQGIARWMLVAAIPLLPGLAAAGPIDRRATDSSAPAPATRRLLESAEYAVIGATPGVALASDFGPGPYLQPLWVWFAVVLLAGRFTIRPLARIATRATLQRDLVVAATEAERARVAADIHDDALQELTLLVHRLDAAGDTEGADMARTVSDRLRAICGDLRLPILDDLGVGPALDWLVLRIERLAGGEVRLERSDSKRPPADVELAFFRVAQEALSNAVKHGQPPILVRYATNDGGASLSIDDAGPGIESDAGEGADRAGHFGLLNMQQRAEAIGAILDVRRWPAGGTHVALEWRAS